jgi:hypothetical protein
MLFPIGSHVSSILLLMLIGIARQNFMTIDIDLVGSYSLMSISATAAAVFWHIVKWRFSGCYGCKY